VFWNLNYWDSVSCLAGEVDRPAVTFPRALLWAVLLVVASYLLPTMAALGVMPQTGEWELGFYGKVAQQVRWGAAPQPSHARALAVLARCCRGNGGFDLASGKTSPRAP
jgi:amino acid transporter